LIELPLSVFFKTGRGAPVAFESAQNPSAQATGPTMLDVSTSTIWASRSGFTPDGHPKSPAYGHLKLPHLN
jgi:hypothetical protein